MSTKKRGLGRGLEALLGTGNKGAAPAADASQHEVGSRSRKPRRASRTAASR